MIDYMLLVVVMLCGLLILLWFMNTISHVLNAAKTNANDGWLFFYSFK